MKIGTEHYEKIIISDQIGSDVNVIFIVIMIMTCMNEDLTDS